MHSLSAHAKKFFALKTDLAPTIIPAHELLGSRLAQVHTSFAIHKEVLDSLPSSELVQPADDLRGLLSTLREAGKQLFIVTNSPLWCMPIPSRTPPLSQQSARVDDAGELPSRDGRIK